MLLTNKILRSKIIGKDGVGIGEKPKGGIGRLLLRVLRVGASSKRSSRSKARCSSHLILCGITTEVCVHTIMREANDIGYWCLLLKDSVGATDAGNHEAAINSVKMQGGVFGWVSDTDHLHEGLKEAQLVA